MKSFTNYISIISLLLLSVFIFSSCATLFKGGNQSVSMNSEPPKAKVYVNGSFMGETPLQLRLKVNKSYTIEFKKEGFENKTVLLNNNVGGGWIVLDVLGGLLPVVIDAATGNWYSLDQDNVNAVLEQQQTTSK